MKRLKVVISDRVEMQIREQVLFIARHSIDNALNWENRLRIAIVGIGVLSAHAMNDDASDRLGQKVQKMVFEKTYLIHYIINEKNEAVEVINFRHGAKLPKAGEP